VIAAIIKLLTGGLVDKVFGLGQAYLTKQISEAEFRAKVEIAAQETAAEIEQSWAQAATDTAKATQATVKASPILQRAWAAVLFLQVVVLTFYQIGAPAFQIITGTVWPSPGISLEWCYLLVATQLGAGPFVFRK
jgi:hypothetical protein